MKDIIYKSELRIRGIIKKNVNFVLYHNILSIINIPALWWDIKGEVNDRKDEK